MITGSHMLFLPNPASVNTAHIHPTQYYFH